MEFKIVPIFNLTISALIALVLAQENELDSFQSISASINQFSLKLLAETTKQAGESLNLALSSYTVWSLLSMIHEGARGKTAQQLKEVLQLSQNKDLFNQNYKSLSQHLLERSNGVEWDTNSAVFTTSQSKINITYKANVKMIYDFDIFPIDFKKVEEATSMINNYFRHATKNRLKIFLSKDDVIDAIIFMATSTFFKGQLKVPFDPRDVYKGVFFDELGRTKGEVHMMYQVGSFVYSTLSELNSTAVELPYEQGDKFSMIIILPEKGSSLSSVLQRMATVSFKYILDSLEKSKRQFGEVDVEVHLPRFAITSDLNLNKVLYDMGIEDMFNHEIADLLGMFPQYLYVSRVLQRTEIELTEGVVSSPIGKPLQSKLFPIEFRVNRDFAYLVVNKITNTIVIVGKFTNPRGI